MHRTWRMGTVLLALGLVASGCYGPFNLTRRLHHWNGQVGDKWENEIAFLVLVLIPAYSFSTLADAIIFNSMEFWTGDNPVNPPYGAKPVSRTKRLSRGDDEVVLTYTPTSEGAQLVIAQYRQGRPAGTVHVERRNGMTIGFDEKGNVLLTAKSRADGGVLIHDQAGKQMAAYSPQDVDQFFETLP